MTANCVKAYRTTFTPKSGDPVPMVTVNLDIEGMNDIVKVQVSESRCQGDPRPGEVYIDCQPRFVKGGGGAIYWKPSLIKFS